MTTGSGAVANLACFIDSRASRIPTNASLHLLTITHHLFTTKSVAYSSHIFYQMAAQLGVLLTDRSTVSNLCSHFKTDPYFLHRKDS